MEKRDSELIDYRFVGRFERVRSNDIALNAVKTEAKSIVLHTSDLMSYLLLRIHFSSSIFFSSAVLLFNFLGDFVDKQGKAKSEKEEGTISLIMDSNRMIQVKLKT